MRAFLLLSLLLLAGCDATGLGGDPTFTITLEEGTQGTLEGDGYAEVRCSIVSCNERFVFEDSGEALYLYTSTSPSLSSVDRTITVGRGNGTQGSLELDGFGTSLDVSGELTVTCVGETVRGAFTLVAHFNLRPGEPVEVRGTYDMPRTAADSWNEDGLPPCQ